MLTSPTKVRQLALETARACRPHSRFTRVSKEFLDAIEAATRAAVVDRVKRHPSLGRTLK